MCVDVFVAPQRSARSTDAPRSHKAPAITVLPEDDYVPADERADVATTHEPRAAHDDGDECNNDLEQRAPIDDVWRVDDRPAGGAAPTGARGRDDASLFNDNNDVFNSFYRKEHTLLSPSPIFS